jgi:hypothetical protein
MPQPEPEDADDEDRKEPTPVAIHVNAKPVNLPSRKVTGEEIKRAAIAQGVEIQLDFKLIEESHGDKKERKIDDSEQITVTDHAEFLAQPRPPVTIIISGRPFEVDEKEISYKEVVDLRYNGTPPTGENVIITVTYSKGPNGKEGTLQPGHSVKVKAGMVFNVIDSSQS